ncbi:MAG: dihydroorotase [Pleurocapsa sp.]
MTDMELLQQVRVIDPDGGIDRRADVAIADGKIIAIETQITDYPSNTAIVDGKNLVLGSGLVDLYSHSGEPGNESRETLADLLASGLAGGFTQIAILPDTIPAIDNANLITSLHQKAKYLHYQTLPQIHFWGAISPSQDSKKMNELAELKDTAVGFTDDYNLGNLKLLKQVLEYIQPWQKPIAIALDRNELTNNGAIREGAMSISAGLLGNPAFSEAAAIAAVLEIVAAIDTPVHIMRVSTQRGVELIADAKQRGVPVTASTTWMHLLFNTNHSSSYDPNLRLEPPLGNKNDQIALIDGVEQGIIDAIAIDHQAYTYEEKTVPFAQAPPGVIGLQLALPLLWQKFVTTGKWSALQLWQALSSRPRQCLQQPPIKITPHQPTELVLFHTQQTWIANSQNLKTPAQNSPWYGQEIIGRVIKTVISSQKSKLRSDRANRAVQN